MIQLPYKEDAYLLASTRFTTAIYAENLRYRREHKVPVVYGSCMMIREKYPLYAVTFVLEMNNETNRVEGIGRIRNRPCYQEMDNVYSNLLLSEHNTYFYTGNHWVSRNTIQKMDAELLEIFENILFKKKTHVKRHAGISVLTETLLVNWLLKHPTKTEDGMRNLLVRIIGMFDRVYNCVL